MRKLFLFIVILLFSSSGSVSADIIHLKNGNTYEGSIVKEDEEKIALKTSIMTVVFNKDEIKAIQRDYPSLESRMATGETFEVIDVLNQKNDESQIKVINKEDLEAD
jgi:hypothetical protein